MSFEADSVLGITQQVMSELGFTPPTSIAGNPDSTVSQFAALLRSCVYELSQVYPWEQRSKEFTITTVASTDEYALPTDFSYFLDQTQWDRTNAWPLLGPRSAQQWAFLKGGITTSGPRYRWRIRGNKFVIHPEPGSSGGGETLAMEYVSNKWYLPSGGDADDEDDYIVAFNDDGDVPYLDKWMLERYLKLKFWETKGFNTAAFQGDFMVIFNVLTGKNKGAPILSTVPRSSEVLLGIGNIPDGNWS